MVMRQLKDISDVIVLEIELVTLDNAMKNPYTLDTTVIEDVRE